MMLSKKKKSSRYKTSFRKSLSHQADFLKTHSPSFWTWRQEACWSGPVHVEAAVAQHGAVVVRASAAEMKGDLCAAAHNLSFNHR